MPKSAYHHGDLKNALIQAGIDIVAAEGVYGLTLRKTARRAGVSHNAPYAHFADKQSLIAAIALEGHIKIHTLVEKVIERHPDDPLKQLVNLAWKYVQFGLESPAHYKITFSGLIENEKNYPSFVEVSQHSFQLLQKMVADCKAAGVFHSRNQPEGLLAVPFRFYHRILYPLCPAAGQVLRARGFQKPVGCHSGLPHRLLSAECYRKFCGLQGRLADLDLRRALGGSNPGH